MRYANRQQFRNFVETGSGAGERMQLEVWASSRMLKKTAGLRVTDSRNKTGRVFKDRHHDGRAKPQSLPPEVNWSRRPGSLRD
jgi:hypothetical protein